jgi:hypothetical protein
MLKYCNFFEFYWNTDTHFQIRSEVEFKPTYCFSILITLLLLTSRIIFFCNETQTGVYIYYIL